MSVFVWTITDQQIREFVNLAEREYPFQPGWTKHTTSEAKAQDREDYLASVIAQLYMTLHEVRGQRDDAEANRTTLQGCLDRLRGAETAAMCAELEKLRRRLLEIGCGLFVSAGSPSGWPSQVPYYEFIYDVATGKGIADIDSDDTPAGHLLAVQLAVTTLEQQRPR